MPEAFLSAHSGGCGFPSSAASACQLRPPSARARIGGLVGALALGSRHGAAAERSRTNGATQLVCRCAQRAPGSSGCGPAAGWLPCFSKCQRAAAAAPAAAARRAAHRRTRTQCIRRPARKWCQTSLQQEWLRGQRMGGSLAGRQRQQAPWAKCVRRAGWQRAARRRVRGGSPNPPGGGHGAALRLQKKERTRAKPLHALQRVV